MLAPIRDKSSYVWRMIERGVILASGLLAAAFLAVAAPVSAADVHPRMVTEAEAPQWRGVGRLNVAGRRFCTATLIADQIAVTAAHCLFHPRSGAPIQPSEMRFVAGLRLGAYAAVRRVVGVAMSERYRFSAAATPKSLRYDIALLRLSEPIGAGEAAAFPIGSPLAGYEPLALVSYSKDRAHAPSIQRPCRMRSAMRRVAAVSCRVTYGASGAPIFTERAGQLRVSAVISAMGRDPAGAPVGLAVMAEPLMEELMAKLARAPSFGGASPRTPAPPATRPRVFR